MAERPKDYNYTEIEAKWQRYWDENKTFRAVDNDDRPKYYILDMFPYPSGAGLHVGHPEGYTASDILARYKRSRGFNVLHPMGWDAFGLPAEQHAIKTGVHPRENTEENISNFKRQIKAIGFAIDWDREINTTDPGYFKWTQWIFLQLFRKGLAYVDDRPVWWCPELRTVLANEEIVDGRSERGNHPVERRALRQWVLRITAYADRLLEGLDEVDWPDSTKKLQTNWISRSEGAEVVFDVAGHEGESITVYTTRPDTLFGATYMVLAPEHPLVEKITAEEQLSSVRDYVKKAAAKSDLDRTELAKEKSGVATGAHAINPVNGKRVPIWVADYVLMSYGTGAIMAVPAHDERDYEFATKFDIPVIEVVRNEDENPDGALPYAGKGKLVNSGAYDGLSSDEAKRRITADLEKRDQGRAAVNYKLRDWLFSRQRYWGEPFPIVWVSEVDYEKAKAAGGDVAKYLPEEPVTYVDAGRTLYAVPLPPGQLPLELPQTDNYKPSGTGESPLAHAKEWLEVWLNTETGETVPATGESPCGKCVRGQRETNTMPQWAGSCWYYLRYIDPKNSAAIVDPAKAEYWGVPDFYIGGAEHAVLHLLYARFWHMVLLDIGAVNVPEPFPKLFHQGIILGELEYIAFKDADGNYVPYHKDLRDEIRNKGLNYTEEKLSEEEIVKEGDTFYKKEPKVAIEAKSFKMSKSRGNVINPDDIIRDYGADALRLYEMFMGPLADMKPWSMGGIEGVFRFLRRVWLQFFDKEGNLSGQIKNAAEEDQQTDKLLHETIKKVTEDIEALRFNTAISQLMVFANHLQKADSFTADTAKTFARLLAPFAPHMGEELWAALGGGTSVVDAHWPEFDESKLATDEVKIIFQVMGKVRGEAMVSKDAEKDEVLEIAKAQERVASHIEGKTIRKVIFVPGKILNIVAN